MLSYARATARTWAEIRVEDVVNNHQAALSELAPGVRHVSVLKANAYGRGAVGTAEILYADGERLFAVACVEEALAVRCRMMRTSWSWAKPCPPKLPFR